MRVFVNPPIQEVPESDYPCLKITNGTRQIVLFTAPGVGVVVDPGTADNRLKLGQTGEFKEGAYVLLAPEHVVTLAN